MNPAGEQLPEEQYLLGELERELHEELSFADGCTIEEITFRGFLNDDNIEVGRFHIGLLYSIRLSGKNIAVLETEKLTGMWVEKQHLMDYYDVMETWSQFIVDEIINKSV